MANDHSNKMGLLWVKDTEKEKFEITINNAYNFYVSTYKDKPTFMYCSNLDKDKEFDYNTITVIPSNLFQSGMIWVTGINLQKTAGQKYDGG